MPTYKSSSMYSATPLSRTRLENFVPPIEISDITEFEEITIDQQFNMRPDLYSFLRYDNKDYWWVFAFFNRDKLRDPVFDFTTGTVIRVPTKKAMIQSGI